MLKIRSTTHITGITVSGSFEDMNDLRDAIISVIGDEGEYFFQAQARRRVPGICDEIRLAYQGKRNTVNCNGVSYYAFNILWPEAAFLAAVLDNFILLSSAKMCYLGRLTEKAGKSTSSVSSDGIALIHFFQELVWNELEHIVGKAQLKAIFGKYSELREIHFKFPQLDGFCTQWLDILNIRYLCSKPEQRQSYLAYILTKIFSVDEEYLSLKNSIDGFLRQEGIRVTGICFADCLYPEKIVW